MIPEPQAMLAALSTGTLRKVLCRRGVRNGVLHRQRVAADHTIRGLSPMTEAANRPIFKAWNPAQGR
jgi:hypothetical protein